MITIEGRSLKGGVAVAVAAVVDARHGIGGVSAALVAEGMKALKAMMPESDYPEAVVVCDTLVMGLSVRIPGVNTIGIAAESDADAPGVEPEVPCVVGLADLVKSISDGDILIVDGNKGIVYVDPDLETIVRYQEMEERAASGGTVYIAAEHLPAKTPDGETVLVYAYVAGEADLIAALDQGADGVVVDPAGWESGSEEDLGAILRAAAGKPIAFAVEEAVEEILRAAMLFAAPHQVTLLFPLASFDAFVTKTSSVLELVIAEALFEDLNPPRVSLGARARDVELPHVELSGEPAMTLIDLRKSPTLSLGQADLEQRLAEWAAGRPAQQLVILLGRRVEAVAKAVRAGARAVAVDPDVVSATKMVIREMGANG